MLGFRNTLSTSCKNSEKEEIAKNPKRRSQCPKVKDNNPSTLFVCNSHSTRENSQEYGEYLSLFEIIVTGKYDS